MLQHRCSWPLVRWQGSPIGCCVGPCALVGVVSIAVWDFLASLLLRFSISGMGVTALLIALLFVAVAGGVGLSKLYRKFGGGIINGALVGVFTSHK